MPYKIRQLTGRIESGRKKVTVYRMIIKDTIEEKILAMQEAKKEIDD